MKKKLLMVVTLLFVLAGCGSGNELEEFTETYNERAESEDVSELVIDEFGEIENYEDEQIQELYESDKYEIVAEYDNDKLIGYSIFIDSSEPFENKEGQGYRASTVVARSLDLSVSGYVNNFEKALRTDIHTYTENGYEVRFVNIGGDSSIPTPLTISFRKE